MRMTAEMGDMWWVIGDKNVIYVWLLTTNQKKSTPVAMARAGQRTRGGPEAIPHSPDSIEMIVGTQRLPRTKSRLFHWVVASEAALGC